MPFSLHMQTDDATLVYYRHSDKESKYLDLESDMGELIRDYNLTFDKYIYLSLTVHIHTHTLHVQLVHTVYMYMYSSCTCSCMSVFYTEDDSIEFRCINANNNNSV